MNMNMNMNMNAAMGGVFLTAAVLGVIIIGLADNPAETALGSELGAESLGVEAGNIIRATVPMTVPDQVTLLASDGIAGVVGSSTLYVSELAAALLKRNMDAMRAARPKAADPPADGADADEAPLVRLLKTLVPVPASSAPAASAAAAPAAAAAADGARARDKALSNAAANADFFLARASVASILRSAGAVPVASVFAVLLAQIPYQLVRQNAMMEMGTAKGGEAARPKAAKKGEGEGEGGGARRLQLKLPGDVRAIDIVADIIKWLEYDVLCTDLAAGTPTASTRARIESKIGAGSH